MTAHEFGMWGFSVLVWVFTVLSALWGYHLVRTAIHSMKITQFLNEVFVQEVVENGLQVEVVEDDDDNEGQFG
jgi:hypothetical protein